MKLIGMCMFCGDQGKTELVDGVHELCGDCAEGVKAAPKKARKVAKAAAKIGGVVCK